MKKVGRNTFYKMARKAAEWGTSTSYSFSGIVVSKNGKIKLEESLSLLGSSDSQFFVDNFKYIYQKSMGCSVRVYESDLNSRWLENAIRDSYSDYLEWFDFESRFS